MIGMALEDFRQIADEEMLSRGFRKLKLVGDQIASYAIGEGDLIRYFGPHAMRRPWGCVMLGTFGVAVPALQNWLSSRGERPSLGRLSYYITNEPQFGLPVAVENKTDLLSLSRWLDAIHSRVLSLPSELYELDVLSAAATSGHLQLLKISTPAFWTSLAQWKGEKGA